MAKGSFATNTLSGKLGAFVFFRRKGEQVSRSWVKPNNAKTRAQGVQRSSLSNIIRMYQASSGFFKSAFENRKFNQSDYNAFVSRNLRKEPQICIPKDMADGGGSVVAPYVISDGSLQPIVITGVGISATTNIALGLDFVVTDATTVGEFSGAILANNTFLMLGDQLSYLSFEQYTYMGYPRLRSRKYEFVIDPNSQTLLNTVMPEQAVAVVGGYLGHGALVYSGAFAWIYSRNTSSGLKVSKQSLIVTSDALYAPYTGASAATRAADSYGDSKEVFLNPSTEVSFADQPTISASVASVRIDGNILSANKPMFSLDTAGTIAAGALALEGSGLSSLQSVSVALTGRAQATDADKTVAVVSTLVVSGDTAASNSTDLAFADIDWVTGIVIKAGAVTLYSWKAYDNQHDNPLG